MMKTIKAVQPYIYPNQLNFKNKPFEAWAKLGGKCVKGWYPKFLHWLLFRYDVFPTLWQNKKEARLLFVQPVSLYFDAGTSVLTHEVIPFFWDCWPKYYDLTEKWLRRHKVKTAIFTARQEMEEIKKRIPELNVIWCPEAVDTSLYKEGKQLKDRTIDLLEFGRTNEKVLGKDFSTMDETGRIFNHICTKSGGKFLFTEEQLYEAMANAKITICLPRNITHPQIAEGVETLTQRYWEAMLSRIVIVGHCPEELINLVGYDPVVEAPLNPSGSGKTAEELIIDILEHIEENQELVDRNRDTALRMAPWEIRMKQVMEWFESHGY